jgi:hypothetical protein
VDLAQNFLVLLCWESVPGDKGAMAAAPQGEDVYATVSAPNHGTTLHQLILQSCY